MTKLLKIPTIGIPYFIILCIYCIFFFTKKKFCSNPASQAYLILLYFSYIVYIYIFLPKRFVATLHQASLFVLFLQYDLVTLGICVIF